MNAVQKCIVYCLVALVGINSLLVASGGAVLCFHDKGFSHFAVTEHVDHGHDCHGHHEHTAHETHSVHDGISIAEHSDVSKQCFDVVLSPLEELAQRTSDLMLVDKLAVTSGYTHRRFESGCDPCSPPQMLLASREPPVKCSMLEQCVLKTVLRI